MPNLEWNKNLWNNNYNWELKGEEWSKAWGNSEAQWFSSLYPRIHRFLQCNNILEIACGYGRWSKFLLGYAVENFTGVDLSKECIDYCSKNFKGPNIDFIKNDGISLKDVSDKKYDFIFSFDSLVHVDPETLNHYINQIIKLLHEDGVCFIHHSNFGSIIQQGNISNEHLGYAHCRDQSSSAKIVHELVIQNGGKILCQEIIDWGGVNSLDCLTTFCKSDSFLNSEEKQIINNQFMIEASIIKNSHSNYCEF